MPTNKQSFLEEAVAQFATCAANYGLDFTNLDDFEKLVVDLLKQSFKNGVKTGFSKAQKQLRQAEGQQS